MTAALADANLDLVGLRAHHFARRRHVHADEQMATAYFGLRKAAEKWDPHHSTISFRTFASHIIDFEMADAMRRQRGRVRSDGVKCARLRFNEDSVPAEDSMPGGADDPSAPVVEDDYFDACCARLCRGDGRLEAILRGRLLGLLDRQIGLRLGVSESRISQLRRVLRTRFSLPSSAASTLQRHQRARAARPGGVLASSEVAT